MNKFKISIFELLRYRFSGALVGVCLADLFWHSDLTAQTLLGIIGFGIAYLTVREM